jgi:hypothetical protein
LQVDRARGTGREYWVPLIIVAVIFAFAAGWRIELPGLYMDAVDPDYLVARMLNPHGHEVPAWVLPGNYLAKRYPILPSLYHGSGQAWLGLPFFMLLGTTVTSLRVVHALFAFAIIWAIYALLSDRDLPCPWAAVACAALAVDPSFVYAFRTQSGLSTAPVVWILLAILKLSRAASAPAVHVRRDLGLSGLFCGLAIFGYFIYLFFLPAVAIALAIAWRDPARRAASGFGPRHAFVLWAAGLCWGLALYVLGYSLLAASQGGFGGLLAYIQETQAKLGAFGSPISLLDRVAHVWAVLVGVVSNAANSTLIFNDYASAPAAAVKIAFLIALPLILWAIAEYRGKASALLRLLLGLELSYVFISLSFGNRLGSHHYVCLVPLMYAALALALANAVAGLEGSRFIRTGTPGVVVFAALIAINVAGDKQVISKLADTHGVGLYSDAIDRFADDVLRTKRDHFVVLPDWGLFMPVVFLTGANVQVASADNFEAARHFLCHQRDVTVGLITGDREARFADYQRRLRWEPPAIEAYKQHDGTVVFEVGTFKANAAAETCRQ